MTPYIIIEQYAGEGRPTVHDFDTVEKAADYLFASHRNDEFGLVWEIGRTAAGVAYHLDREADFIAAWKKREAEELEEQWNDLESGRENDHFKSRGSLDAFIYANRTGPFMRKRGIILEAAE